ncbi:amidohydrolase 3 [Trichodelitschia bisporula]|uniref:Amidohydrolase 3 n=1 Tax=Trichodelitschia bisporula TaxID=703511 RepID=A0A6G1I7W8_9PEZI|nr:amidohydrolase 3 [Trichodelitschia bisporula]
MATSSPEPGLILQNGRFFAPQDPIKVDQNAFQECMIIQNRLITHIGPSTGAVVTSARENGFQTLSLDNKIILPGFIDSHMHLLLLGLSLTKLDLSTCTDLPSIRSSITAYAAAHPHLPRILCRGWMHSMTDGKALASMIDDLDPRPIFIDAKDLHSTWCSTSALEEMRVAELPSQPGGFIERDEAGNPTGLIAEASVLTLVWPHLASVASEEDKLAALSTAIDEYSAAGYTGLVDMAMDQAAWDALLLLRSRQKLPVRIAAHWLITPSTPDDGLAQVRVAVALNELYSQQTSPNLRIAGIKIITDGVIDACTAALSKPYADPVTHCPPLWTAEMLGPVVAAADAAGLQVALHAIGDAAIHMSIDALATCTPGRRHRVEHLELASPEDARRLGQLGITASVQAVHADPAILRAWPRLLGEERTKRAFAYREFKDGGAVVALGTDAPTAPLGAWGNLYTAVTRRSTRAGGEELEPVNPEFALELADAVAAATQGAALACFAEGTCGSLKEGLSADFVVADVEWKGEGLIKGVVRETWFEGRKVFSVEE